MSSKPKTEISNWEPYRAQRIHIKEGSNEVAGAGANREHTAHSQEADLPKLRQILSCGNAGPVLPNNVQSFPRHAKNLSVNILNLNISNLLPIVTKGQCRSTKQDT